MKIAPVNKSRKPLEKIIFMKLVIQLMRICFYRKKFLFVLLALSVTNLLESTLELWNAGTGYSIHVAAVAALEEVVGNSRNHSTIVSAKLEGREDAVEVASLSQHGAQA